MTSGALGGVFYLSGGTTGMGNACEDAGVEHDWDDSYGGNEQYCSRCGMPRSEYERDVHEQRQADAARDA